MKENKTQPLKNIKIVYSESNYHWGNEIPKSYKIELGKVFVAYIGNSILFEELSYGDSVYTLSSSDLTELNQYVSNIVNSYIPNGEVSLGSNCRQELEIICDGQVYNWVTTGAWGKYEILFTKLVNFIKNKSLGA